MPVYLASSFGVTISPFVLQVHKGFLKGGARVRVNVASKKLLQSRESKVPMSQINRY